MMTPHIPAHTQALIATDEHDRRVNSQLTATTYGMIPGNRQVLTQADVITACTGAQLRALAEHFNQR